MLYSGSQPTSDVMRDRSMAGLVRRLGALPGFMAEHLAPGTTLCTAAKVSLLLVARPALTL